MIRNERQYRITKAQANKFAQALVGLRAPPAKDKLLARLERDALRSQLGDLRRELEEYEVLRSGRSKSLAVESFDQLPSALVKTRIAAGLSQRQLAERLGLKEQQIQRYEATDYRAASLSRLTSVIEALGVAVECSIQRAGRARRRKGQTR
jgi:hypothetical protein